MSGIRKSPSIHVMFRRGFLTFSLTSLLVFGLIVYWRFFSIMTGEMHAQLASECVTAQSLASVFVEDHLDRLTIVAANGDIRTALEDFDRHRDDRSERLRLLARIEKVLINYRNNLGSSVAELLVVDAANSKCIVDILPVAPPKPASSLIGGFLDDPIVRDGLRNPVSKPFFYNSRFGLVTLAQAAAIHTDAGDSYVVIQYIDAAALAIGLQNRMLIPEKPWNVRFFTQTGTALTPEKSTPLIKRGESISNPGVLRSIMGESGTQYYTNENGEYVI